MAAPQEKKHVTLHITGKVQGVFFRANTKRFAKRHNITGTVQNNSDGSVTVEAEGSAKALAHLENWCRRGPTDARIDSCEFFPGKLIGYNSFQIKKDPKTP